VDTARRNVQAVKRDTLMIGARQASAWDVARGTGLALGTALLLGACAGDGGSSNGDPGARPLPSGQSCQSVRAELNRLDAQGAQGKVEAVQRGKGSAADKAFAERYNALLNQYLGARCHT
jgi:hypothetical protein